MKLPINDKPLISIIVPVYNVEQYLNRSVDSLLKQTYTNLEILLVDDGSTDRSSIICDSYASCDNRIKVIHKKKRRIIRCTQYSIRSNDWCLCYFRR